MNDSHITFTRKTDFLGRNGTYKSSGIIIERCHSVKMVDDTFIRDDVIQFNPFTTRNFPGKCYVQVPVSNIPRLIRDLRNICNLKPLHMEIRDETGTLLSGPEAEALEAWDATLMTTEEIMGKYDMNSSQAELFIMNNKLDYEGDLELIEVHDSHDGEEVNDDD